MAPKIVVVGSANTDMVVHLDEIPSMGETVLGGQFAIAQGGKGANQAVAAARLGGDVTLVARLGSDNFGVASKVAYQQEGINTDFIVCDQDVPSGVALIMVNRKGENIIAVAPGANGRLSPTDVVNAESAFQVADILLVQLEIPVDAVQTAIDLAQRYHLRVILNPAPAVSLPDPVLRVVNYITPNESELTMLLDLSGLHGRDAAHDFREMFGFDGLIVTEGAKGAWVLANHMEYHVPGFSVDAVDSVGAGDAFNGAIAVALSRNMDLFETVKFANAVGALSVTKAGAQPSLPTGGEVKGFLKKLGL